MSSPFPTTNEYIYTLKLNRLAILTEGPTPEESQIIAAHWAYLVDLHQKGILLSCGRTTVTDETAFALGIFKANSREEAELIMQNDPVVKAGLMRGEVFPFQMLLREGQSAGVAH